MSGDDNFYMKIVMIHGQNHKGSTYHIGRMLAEVLETEENVTGFLRCGFHGWYKAEIKRIRGEP